MSQKRPTKQFSPLWRLCEDSASLFVCKESSGKRFSPLYCSCEARVSLFKCHEVFITVQVLCSSSQPVSMREMSETAVLTAVEEL